MNRPEITYNDHMVTVTSAQSNEVAVSRPDPSCQSRNLGYTYVPGQSNPYLPASYFGAGPLFNGDISDNWLIIEENNSSGIGQPSFPGGPWILISPGFYLATFTFDGELEVTLTIT